MPYADPDERRRYQLEWKRKRRDAWLMANGPCARCGSAVDLEVDHVDPKQKVSHRIWSWSAVRRDAELAKCQVLCRPCHVAKGDNIRRGDDCKLTKLSDADVVEVKRRRLAGESATGLADEFGVSKWLIYKVAAGRLRNNTGN